MASIDDKMFLMLIILNAGVPVTKACQEVGIKMGVNGETLRQRFYKLKREADELIGKTGDAPPTPSGKKASTKATPKSASKRKVTQTKDEEEAGTPSKKQKAEPVKNEDEDEA